MANNQRFFWNMHSWSTHMHCCQRHFGQCKTLFVSFCDASTTALDTVVHLYQKLDNAVKVYQLFSKTRLAPVIGMSIPRLELLAVVIGCRWLEFVNSQLHIFVDPHIFVVWTLVFKNLVVGWKIDAVWRHNKLISWATHANFNEGLQCITVSYLGYTMYMYFNQFNLSLNIKECF